MREHLIGEIGKQLGPEYVDIRTMIEGGMGTLFRAHRLGLDVDVVIKRVKQQYVGTLDQRAEANILKRLKHSYLPRIYDIIQGSDGYVYTVMDLIPGQDMDQTVKRSGPVNQHTAHRWACQLCEVVAYLHSQNPTIIHQDIKPSNVMITPEGNICLIDFNTSLTYENDRFVHAVTHGFAAPEQYGFSQSDACSDIYSLGILINVMLTGKHPSQQLASGRWGRIVTRCTQVTPSKRYKNVLRLLNDL